MRRSYLRKLLAVTKNRQGDRDSLCNSKNGRPELVSLLQYMKNIRLDNPQITVKDKKIEELGSIVEEVKQSEEVVLALVKEMEPKK